MRSLDNICPAYRYNTIAVIRGPYCTGAFTPAGAVPPVTTPHPHRRLTTRCSVTSTAPGGRSNSCRRSTPTSGASAREPPQPRHPAGSCRLVWSGFSTCASVCPRCPFSRPGLRCPPFRNGFGLGGGLSNPRDDGGWEELSGFRPSRASSSAIRSFAAGNIPCNCTTSTASSSYDDDDDGGGRAGEEGTRP